MKGLYESRNYKGEVSKRQEKQGEREVQERNLDINPVDLL